MSDIKDRIVRIVAEYLDIKPAKVVDEARFIEDLGADSLDIVEMIMAFEEEFDCEIVDDDAEKLTTVGAACAFIEQKKAVSA